MKRARPFDVYQRCLRCRHVYSMGVPPFSPLRRRLACCPQCGSGLEYVALSPMWEEPVFEPGEEFRVVDVFYAEPAEGRVN